jgi:hypothetical protein
MLSVNKLEHFLDSTYQAEHDTGIAAFRLSQSLLHLLSTFNTNLPSLQTHNAIIQLASILVHAACTRKCNTTVRVLDE